MTDNQNETLCVQCGSRGFKRITKQYNSSLSVSALECENCQAVIYEHETMAIIQQAQNEQSVTKEII